MTELEQAAVDFFKAILKTGERVLGHPGLQFKIEATIGVKPEDTDKAKVISFLIQEALDNAKAVAKPVTIEGTSVQ